MSKKFTAKLGNHKVVAVANEHELDYPSVDIYMQDENGGLELIASVEDDLGKLRLLAYTDLSNDDFTMSLDISSRPLMTGLVIDYILIRILLYQY